MKKRILFVDDEINLLKALKRSLRNMRTEWDMSFAEGAEPALDALSMEVFDVLVTDMRMPGMDGAALLKVAKDKYPQMIRIILSGYSDQELVMKTVKTAHQYLSKPWETAALVNAVKQACRLHDFIDESSMQHLMGKIENVPSIPRVYQKIVKTLQSGDASVAAVGSIISEDIGMTSKVLQLVNSSFFSRPGHVADAKEAVVVLGMDVIQALVLHIDIFSSFSQSTMAMVDVEAIHEHCIRTSSVAGQIAKMENFAKEQTDYVVMAGILHDIGKLVLAKASPKKYTDAIKLAVNDQRPLFKVERELLGVSHAEVGSYLLGLWGFDRQMIEAVAYHHEPGRMESDVLESCGLLHAADLIDWGAHPRDGIKENVDIEYFEKLKLRERLSFWKQNLAGL